MHQMQRTLVLGPTKQGRKRRGPGARLQAGTNTDTLVCLRLHWSHPAFIRQAYWDVYLELLIDG